MKATLGKLEGEQAKSIKTAAMIKMGTRRSSTGGGGSGGNTTGNTKSDTVSTTITTADIKLKYLHINLLVDKELKDLVVSKYNRSRSNTQVVIFFHLGIIETFTS